MKTLVPVQTTVLGDELDLFHTPHQEPYATIGVNSHCETWPLGSKTFRQLLERRFYELNGTMPSKKTMQDAMRVMEGQARFDGPELPVHLRVAGLDDAIYLDLANESWEAVAITPDGWQVVQRPPVKFRRTSAMAPLPRPEKGGSIEELRPFVNVGSDEDWRLLVAFLVSTFRPTGPYPVLVVNGQQGAAKSTLTRVMRALTDPNQAAIRSMARSVRDLFVSAQHSWVLAFDNLSSLSTPMSDALCCIATGGSFAARKNFSDAEEVTLDAQRSVIVNGIEDIVTRNDLLDRAIVLPLPTLSKAQWRDERQFWHAFEAARPRILGALLDAVSMALRNQDMVTLTACPRMADFALWSCAAAPALGWTAEGFMQAYEQNIQSANDLALDASPVAHAVLKFLEHQTPWEGTSTQLLAVLTPYLDGVSGQERPRTAQTLSCALRRLAPNLRQAGVDITFWQKNGGNRDRLIALRKVQSPATADDAHQA